MICQNISELLGIECSPMDDSGTLAMLSTPFTFADGDPVPLFVQTSGQSVRFFDDGLIAVHFSGRGLRLETQREGRFLATAAQNNGATYTDWILQTTAANPAQAQQAFANYMNAMAAICAWERENEGMSTDIILLVDEVALAYHSINPAAKIVHAPTFTGISGKDVQLDLLVDDVGVAVTSLHHVALNAALHKVVDISQSTQNLGRKLRFVLDDRADPEKARSEANILQAAAEVQMLSRLERAVSSLH